MDENYHEKISLKLSRLQVFVYTISIILFTILSTTCIIIFTPIRQIVPGYTREALVENVYSNRMLLDSLQNGITSQTLMLEIIQTAIEGNIPVEEATSIKDSLKDYSNIEYRRSIADSLLRIEVESSDPYTLTTISVHGQESSFSDRILFYSPVNGKCVKSFDSQTFTGVDIETMPNEGVKACLSGYVVFTDWSPEWGYIIIVQHENHLLSMYGYTSALLKNNGDYVEAGEVIAITGRSLHFELWYNGFPMNPQNYLTF